MAPRIVLRENGVYSTFLTTPMKKILLPLLTISILAFAYTSTDVSNANYLANQGIITQQSSTAGFRLNDTITRAEAVGIALKIK